MTMLPSAALSAELELEKDELKFGFIKLTDCAALVIAKELGYFEDEGLFVTLEAQANWKILLDRVISVELDGADVCAVLLEESHRVRVPVLRRHHVRGLL